MDRVFRIHCSQISQIMGRTGLTDKQLIKLQELDKKANDPNAKPLTELMKAELDELKKRHANPDLSDTCKSYLKKWYAGDKEQIHSKYLDKGNMMEDDAIDLMADVLGYGMASKNKVTFSDEFMIGTCDVDLPDMIVDVKCPWDNKTFLDNIFGINPDYEWQLRGYLRLWRKDKACLFYALMDTPEMDYTLEVSYSHLPIERRWIAYMVERDEAIENKILARVIQCREWLAEYDKLVSASLGKIH